MYLEKAKNIQKLPECESECVFCTKLLSAYNNLVERHKKSVTTNKRILQLSKPRRYKGVPVSLTDNWNKSRTYRTIIIVNKSDQLEHTRTEQLALPKVSQFIELKRHPSFSSFHPLRKESVNLLMKRSMNSVYSCLSNVTFAPESQQKKPHVLKNPNHINDLAKPKKDFSLINKSQEATNDDAPYKLLNRKRKFLRTVELAKPKSRANIPTNNWTLTKAIKTYEATRRIKEMALPRQAFLSIPKKSSIVGNRRRKSNVARLAALAKPTPARMATKMFVDNNDVKSKRKSINVKLSTRLIELSSPRIYFQNTIRPKPYSISKGALKAKASPRTKILAQPLIRH